MFSEYNMRASMILAIFIASSGVAHDDETVAGIKFIYYNGKLPKNNVKYSITQFSKIPSHKTFRKNNLTVLYIHGYEESPSSGTVRYVVKQFLKLNAVNIVVLDWSNLSDHAYLNNAARNTDMVGRAAGNYLLTAVGKSIHRRKFYIVAHSLGCHVGASIGRTFMLHGVTLSRITGLDCAFPGYYPSLLASLGLPLSKELADFVDAIHTDSGRYGTPIKIGHVDFWPNGGSRRQPGCKNVNIFQSIGFKTVRDERCSHKRACALFGESINKPKTFKSIQCSDYEMFQQNRCNKQATGFMGFGASKTLKGNFYLTTGDQMPYGLGENGIKGLK